MVAATVATIRCQSPVVRNLLYVKACGLLGFSQPWLVAEQSLCALQATLQSRVAMVCTLVSEFLFKLSSSGQKGRGEVSPRDARKQMNEIPFMVKLQMGCRRGEGGSTQGTYATK